VDMTLNGGLGDVEVTNKNVAMSGHLGLLGETVTAVRHPNRTDFWIIAVGRGANTYLNIWKVDKNGINSVCKESTEIPGLNTSVDAPEAGGYLVTSRNGDKWAYSCYRSQYFCFGKFDSQNGKFITVKKRSREAINSGYGTAFSLSGKYLYLTRISGGNFSASTSSVLTVFDFDALHDAASPETVTHIRQIIATGPQNGTAGQFGALIYGPDEYLYVAEAASNHLYVITNPEYPSALKIYRLKGFLGNRTDKPVTNTGVGGVSYTTFTNWGLPTFAAHWFSIELILPYPPSGVCAAKSSVYTMKVFGGAGLSDVGHVEIIFGSKASDKFVINSPAHGVEYPVTYAFPKRGIYPIEVNAYDKNGDLMPLDSKKYTVRVSRCMIPVNHNMSVMEYE